jgi:hypothetical protein
MATTSLGPTSVFGHVARGLSFPSSRAGGSSTFRTLTKNGLRAFAWRFTTLDSRRRRRSRMIGSATGFPRMFCWRIVAIAGDG